MTVSKENSMASDLYMRMWDSPIAAIWLPHATNFAFVFLLVSPAGFVGSEQD